MKEKQRIKEEQERRENQIATKVWHIIVVTTSMAYNSGYHLYGI